MTLNNSDSTLDCDQKLKKKVKKKKKKERKKKMRKKEFSLTCLPDIEAVKIGDHNVIEAKGERIIGLSLCMRKPTF